MKSSIIRVIITILVAGVFTASSHAMTVLLSDTSGLSAEVQFSLIDATTLEVRAKNTSTGAPDGFLAADQILTSVAWDFGGITSIASGSVKTGPTSASVNFSVTSVGPNADVSGEFGYGNSGTTGLYANYISGNQAGITSFGGPNLDGPTNLNGPQGGLIASPAVVPLGGLGAIQDEWLATLTLSDPIADLSFLANGIMVEYGSDAAFLPGEPEGGTLLPEPSTVLLAAFACLALIARRHRRRRRCGCPLT